MHDDVHYMNRSITLLALPWYKFYLPRAIRVLDITIRYKPDIAISDVAVVIFIYISDAINRALQWSNFNVVSKLATDESTIYSTIGVG